MADIMGGLMEIDRRHDNDAWRRQRTGLTTKGISHSGCYNSNLLFKGRQREHD